MRKILGRIIGLIFFLVGCVIFIQIIRFAPLFYQYFFTKEISLRKTNNHINILLLGIGGGTHEGPNLTDSIIFASIDPDKNKATLVSLPRDLWVPELGSKINAAYADGEDKQKGGGVLLAKAMVSKVLGQPVDYTIRIDFNGFIKAVDLVGGLDVAVERTLDDYAYPIEGKEEDTCGHTEDELKDLGAQVATGSATELDSFPCRYKHLHVPAGQNHMDGKTALEFVRSRHAMGIEGSDFSRSKRQSKVLSAFKQKVLSPETLLNPVKLISLYNAVKENIDTDIPEASFDDFLKLAQKMKGGKIESFVIDEGDDTREGLLINPPISSEYNNAWVLIPKAGNGIYSDIQSYVTCVIKGGVCADTPTPTLRQSPTTKKR
jgi:LCP family protein required for cell wall assembly